MEEKNDLVSPLLWDACAKNSSVNSTDKELVELEDLQIKNTRINHVTLKKLAMISYGLFLFGRLIALIIYVARTINCCTKEKKTSFQCDNGAFVAHDMEIEMAWVISCVINIAICLRVLFSWHKVSGMKTLVRKLIKLPGFWSLIFLFLVSCSGYCIMTVKNDTSFFQNAMFFLLAVQNVSITTIVAILNYTHVLYFIELAGYQRSVRTLIKLTHIFLFIEFFTLFLIGTVQFGFQVTGLDYSAESTSSFHKIFAVMRRFGELIYYYNIEKFLWVKLFVDNRDILSHMEMLYADYHE